MSTTMSELLNRKATEFYTRPGERKEEAAENEAFQSRILAC